MITPNDVKQLVSGEWRRWVQVGAALTARGLEAVRRHAEAHRDRCRVVSANWLLDCDEQRCLVSPLAGEHLLTPLHTASLTSLRQVAAPRFSVLLLLQYCDWPLKARQMPSHFTEHVVTLFGCQAEVGPVLEMDCAPPQCSL